MLSVRLDTILLQNEELAIDLEYGKKQQLLHVVTLMLTELFERILFRMRSLFLCCSRCIQSFILWVTRYKV